MGHFTQAGTEQLSKEAHTLEVYCQIPPQYGKYSPNQSSLIFILFY